MNARRSPVVIVSGLVLVAGLVGPGPSRGAEPSTKGEKAGESKVTLGQRLFLREWVPEDPRGRGGDGLGPVFNERSCVACHGLGGPGGGGTLDRNVELLSALASVGKDKPRPDRSGFAAIHPGLAETGTIVLHRFGLSPAFPAWRRNAIVGEIHGEALARAPARTIAEFLKSMGETEPEPVPPSLPAEFRMVVSKRNSPALFGAGRIDAIPDAVIEAEAKRQAEWSGVAIGRVSRLGDGRIGRFGWKAQVPGLEQFVLTACAVELGLEVPGHPQAADPLGYGANAPGLDLSGDDCRALVAYVRDLPSPVERPSKDSHKGRAVFDRMGCADCHRPELGGVEGIYSDLLLHDMGQSLSDSGMYYGPDEESSPGVPKGPEWRTPPLWGVADSAPYLHDGRAPTLASAISAHDGQARGSATLYHRLSDADKRLLLKFLHSLKVPDGARLTRRQLLAVREADELVKARASRRR